MTSNWNNTHKECMGRHPNSQPLKEQAEPNKDWRSNRQAAKDRNEAQQWGDVRLKHLPNMGPNDPTRAPVTQHGSQWPTQQKTSQTFSITQYMFQ